MALPTPLPNFRITDLGPNWYWQWMDISQPPAGPAHSTVVGTQNVAPGSFKAVSYDSVHKLQQLDKTLGPVAGTVNFATGVNATNQIAWMQDVSAGAGVYVPCQYANGVLTHLPLLPPLPFASYDYYTRKINGSGTIVGIVTATISLDILSFKLSFTLGLPFSNNGTATTILNAKTSPFLVGEARSINDAGAIVGYSGSTWDYQNSTPHHAFYYPPGGPMVDLNTMVAPGQSTGMQLVEAYAINANRDIVGFGTVGGTTRAFLFANGVVTDLNTLAGAASVAYDISNNGWIVGQLSTSPFGVACVFDAGGIPIDLNTLPSIQGHGWFLISANAVNDYGQIAGFGFYKSVWSGFLLTPT
jgi:probable HAF family extracellular repeat protein